MMTALGIILADLLLFVLFVCQYRQELGLSVNGSYDEPAPRKKPARNPPSPPPPPSNRAGRVRQILGRP